jgi:predicted dehydrogenase
MAQPLRLAVIGASGGMGRRRVEQFTADPRSRVVAVVARDLARLRETITDEAIRVVTDPQEIYAADDVDAVVISIFNRFHYEHVKAALQAGKHVHCEYPLTDSLEQYDELVALAQEQELVLHHALTVRAEGLHRALKDALAEMGEPRAAYYRYYGVSGWYVQPELRGDMFCALHIHFIEQFVDFFGQPERVVAHGIERDGKCSAVVMMQWPEGLVGTVEFAMGFTDKPGYMGTIVTTDGWCGFSTDPVLHVRVEQGGQRSALAPPTDTSQAEDARSFLDEVFGTGGPQSDLATGRNAIALCLECSKQLQS